MQIYATAVSITLRGLPVGPIDAYLRSHLACMYGSRARFCYFLPYSVIVFYFEQRYGTMGYLSNLVIGYLAELTRIPFNYPIEVVATYTQVCFDATRPSTSEAMSLK